MAEPTAEVRIQLVADDQSSAALDSVKAGMDEILRRQNEMMTRQKEVGDGTIKISKEFLAVAAAVALTVETAKQAVEFTEHLAEASLEAAGAAEEQEKQMAGQLFLMDQGKHSMAELRDYTGQVREEFEELGIKSGYATKELVDTFDKLTEKGNLGSEAAKRLTEQMSVVGRVVPGGIAALAQGMSGVESGMVRARNPIVQLIAATQTLHGNAKAVAQQMQHMTPVQQMKIAEDAINKQAEALKRMGGVVEDLPHLRKSFEGIKESFLTSLGQPMIDALVPNLVKLRDFLIQHMEQIKAFGEKVGAAAADAIEYVSAALEGIYNGLTYNWDEFKKTFNDIFGDWVDAWKASKSTTGEIKQEFMTIGTTLRDVFVEMARYVKASVEVLMDVWDFFHGDNVGTTRAGIQGQSLGASSEKPELKAAEWEKEADKYIAKAEQAGADMNKVYADVAAQRAEHEGVLSAADQTKTDVSTGDWDKVNQQTDAAKANGYNDLLEYQASIIAGSDAAVDALQHGQLHIAGGLDDLIKMLGDKSPELAKKLRDMGHNLVANQGGIKPPPGINIGSATFHIKQDFRDQDPDRIAIMFQKKVASAATSRITSRQSGFGGF